MKIPFQRKLLPGAALLAAVAGTLLWAAPALDVRQVRELLQRLGGANWKKDQIEIKSISPGIGGDNAIVTAQIETAFRFARQDGAWRIAEIRLGDQQWESLELLEEAVRREKERRTIPLLKRLAEGLEAYRREHGQYVAADDIAVLLDHLSLRFSGPPVRFDLWGEQFRYRGTAAGYRLSSTGPDRQPDTPDDIVIENGVLRTTTQ